ncbi:uncharacterized protein AMSG_12368 [Thecamonas trahens ATCC 50062]|uniref:CAP-Gly domain-containing protein n=1 Tax=Thecamonas trahens ATCC 50062 TaxID=461836 RepID=A0A0L0DSC0_THETB|nr:hypothetical protein AMSG_12368 [Thecamonas trahens ATCC 50062]KNC54931.1 hypothetical protein AMSG_12368 [Thecamonas trahens ATCC 50062]|eukprot:XP_013753532.1 hypothetical protein AMSG_12368 [Thecamonas trahens ATCC 50062]
MTAAQPLQLVAGSSFTFNLALRHVSGLPAGDGGDRGLAVISLDGADMVTHTQFVETGSYIVTAAAPTVAGVYHYRLGVNGRLFINGMVTVDAVVSPGPAAGPGSYLVDAPLSGTVLLETDVAAQFAIFIGDAYGNPAATMPTASDVDIVLQLGIATITISDFSLANGVLTFDLKVTEGGAYTLLVRLFGKDIRGSPFVVNAAETCLPGTAIAEGGLCADCAAGTYSDAVNVVACSACPEFTTSSASATSFLNCSCLPMFWYGPGPRAPGKACIPCLAGAQCAGGDDPPRAAPGYEASDDRSAFVACPRPQSCIGDGRCATGYQGRLCAQCASNYYRLGNTCRKCSGSNALVLVVLLAMVFAFVVAVVWINNRNTKIYGYAAFVIALNTLQAVAIYGTIQLDWHPIAQAVFDIVSLFNLNFDLASPECGLDVGDVWMFKWAATMLMPIVLIIPFSMVALAFTAWLICSLTRSKPRRSYMACTRQAFGAAARGYSQTILLLYLPVMFSALRYVDCTDVGGGIVVMTTNPQRRCYTSSWWSLLPLILSIALFYALSIPLALGALLWREHARLDDLTFGSRYAYLVARYKPHLYWYELMIMARKLAVALAVCAIRSPVAKASLLGMFYACVLVVSAMLQHRPYGTDFHNWLDAVTLGLSQLLLWGGVITSSPLLGNLVVIASISALVVVVIGAVLYEAYRIRTQDEAEADFAVAAATATATDTSAAVFDFGDQALDEFTMADSTLATLRTGFTRCVVRFVGATHFGLGEWIGVETREGRGSGDGSVDGRRYFTCAGFGVRNALFLKSSALAFDASLSLYRLWRNRRVEYRGAPGCLVWLGYQQHPDSVDSALLGAVGAASAGAGGEDGDVPHRLLLGIELDDRAAGHHGGRICFDYDDALVDDAIAAFDDGGMDALGPSSRRPAGHSTHAYDDKPDNSFRPDLVLSAADESLDLAADDSDKDLVLSAADESLDLAADDSDKDLVLSAADESLDLAADDSDKDLVLSAADESLDLAADDSLDLDGSNASDDDLVLSAADDDLALDGSDELDLGLGLGLGSDDDELGLGSDDLDLGLGSDDDLCLGSDDDDLDLDDL